MLLLSPRRRLRFVSFGREVHSVRQRRSNTGNRRRHDGAEAAQVLRPSDGIEPRCAALTVVARWRNQLHRHSIEDDVVQNDRGVLHLASERHDSGSGSESLSLNVTAD
jgi:hypothetical protein